MTIFFYVAINLMMVMGLAPVVGIPLPLFSYGGSSMLTVMTCVGMILAIENDSKTGTRRFPSPRPALFRLRRTGQIFAHRLDLRRQQQRRATLVGPPRTRLADSALAHNLELPPLN